MNRPHGNSGRSFNSSHTHRWYRHRSHSEEFGTFILEVKTLANKTEKSVFLDRLCCQPETCLAVSLYYLYFFKPELAGETKTAFQNWTQWATPTLNHERQVKTKLCEISMDPLELHWKSFHRAQPPVKGMWTPRLLGHMLTSQLSGKMCSSCFFDSYLNFQKEGRLMEELLGGGESGVELRK